MNASQEPAPPHQPGEATGGYGDPATAGPDGNTVGYGTPEGGFGLAHPSGPAGEPATRLGGFASWNGRTLTPRPWKRTVTVAVGSFLAILVLGGPLGVIWHYLAPGVPVINAGQAGVVVNDPSPEEYIAADGWFTLLGLAFGLIVAIVAWLLLRRDRGPFLLLGVVLGALGAGRLVAPWLGEMIGRSGYQRWLETAQQGSTYLAPPEVHSLGPTLVPAFAAAIALTLMAGWSNDPDLDRPGAHPGYGPNNDYPGEPLDVDGYPSPGWPGDGPEPSAGSRPGMGSDPSAGSRPGMGSDPSAGSRPGAVDEPRRAD